MLIRYFSLLKPIICYKHLHDCNNWTITFRFKGPCSKVPNKRENVFFPLFPQMLGASKSSSVFGIVLGTRHEERNPLQQIHKNVPGLRVEFPLTTSHWKTRYAAFHKWREKNDHLFVRGCLLLARTLSFAVRGAGRQNYPAVPSVTLNQCKQYMLMPNIVFI